MKRILFFSILLSFFIACTEDGGDNPPPQDNSKAVLSDIVITVNGVDYTTNSSGTFGRRLAQKIPYQDRKLLASVKSISISAGAKASLKEGDTFDIDTDSDAVNAGLEIVITSGDGTNSSTYRLFMEYEFPEIEVVENDPVEFQKAVSTPVVVEVELAMQTPDFFVDPGFANLGPWAYWGGRGPDLATLSNGRKDIRFEEYPSTDLYDGGDPDYLQYAALMMKYSGIDIALLNAEVSIHPSGGEAFDVDHTRDFAKVLEKVGLKFIIRNSINAIDNGGISSNDQLVSNLAQVLTLYENEFFTAPNYFKEDNLPVLYGNWETGSFDYNIVRSQWDGKVKFMMYPNVEDLSKEGDVRELYKTTLDDGFERVNSHFSFNCPAGLDCYIPIEPSFHPVGRDKSDPSVIDFADGDFLRRGLDFGLQLPNSHIFLKSWNNYRNGTIIEPTLDRGSESLQVLQEKLGVPFDASVFDTIAKMYQFRKSYKADEFVQKQLDQVFEDLVALKVDEAKAIIDSIE